MKKLLTALLLFSCTSYGQYFEWNMFVSTTYGTDEGQKITKLQTSPQGNVLLSFENLSSGSTYLQNVHVYDSIGALNYSQQDYEYQLNYDSKGNLMEVIDSGPTIIFNYYRSTDTLTFYLNQYCSVAGDSSGDFYIFYYPGTGVDSTEHYDPQGNYVNTIYQHNEGAVIDDVGNIYFADYYYYGDSVTVTKIHQDGIILGSYVGMAPFTVSQNGKLWINRGGSIMSYDPSGMVDTITLANASVPLMACDKNNNLFVWQYNTLSRYVQDTLAWTYFNIKSDFIEKIAVDDSSNIYYAGTYNYNKLDNSSNFVRTEINIPPSLYAVCDTYDYTSDYSTSVFIGKINHAVSDSFNAVITAVDVSNSPILCTATAFNVHLDLYHRPLGNLSDPIYIELSDSAGSFATPYIIGHGFGAGVRCTIPDSIPEGNNYLIRARFDTLFITQPYSTVFSVNTSPAAPIILDNSIFGNQSCMPFILKTNSQPGLQYIWMDYNKNDPFDPWEGMVTLPDNDSVLIISQADWYNFQVNVLETATGCSRSSDFIEVEQIYPVLPQDLSIPLPDTLRINDGPVNLLYYQDGIITGNGVRLTNNNYIFYPDSAQYGWNIINRSFPHSGTPCIPYSNNQYIYIDSVPANIILDTISPSLYMCPFDTFYVSFNLLDSSVYDTTNLFVAEASYHNNFTGEYFPFTELAQSKLQVIPVVLPDHSNNLRFRVRSTQTGEISTLNPDGLKYSHNSYAARIDKPYSNNSTCLALNQPMTFYGYNGSFELYRNDTLVYDTNGVNSFTYLPQAEGSYKLIYTSNGCTNELGPYVIDDSAYIPSLVITPTAIYQMCSNTPLLLTATTDSLSVIQWYFNEVLQATNIDSFYADNQGLYSIRATSGSCPVTVESTRSITEKPEILILTPETQSICYGDSVYLSVSSNADVYKWYNSANTLIATGKKIYVKAAGSYYVLVTDTNSGCYNTSKMFHVRYKVPMSGISPSGTVNIATGYTITLTYTNTFNHDLQWYFNNAPIAGATQDSYVASQAGLYYISATDSTGCTALSNATLLRRQYHETFITPPEVRHGPAEEEISCLVHPNPAKDNFVLWMRSPALQKVKLSLFDIYGRIIKQYEFEMQAGEVKKELSLDKVPDGIYTLSISCGDYKHSLPLLISY